MRYMDTKLPKTERLCGVNAVKSLMSNGKWSSCEIIRYCYRKNPDTNLNRIMVSVPKKLFKRAVKRNLLKRRLREAYRSQKEIIEGLGIDFLLSYSSNEILDSKTIKETVKTILERLQNSCKSK